MNLKEKILEVSYELFATKGYDETTVADIIKEAGASKGGFYHHFKSKEAILERITFASVEDIRDYYKSVLEEEAHIVERFSDSFYRLNEIKKDSVKDWDKIKRIYTFKGNHLLLRRMGEAFEQETASFYYELICQGNEKGQCQVKYPKQLSELWSREVIKFHRSSRKIFTGVHNNEEDFLNMLLFNEALINDQLGLSKHRVELVDMGKSYLEAMKILVSKRGGSND